MIRSDGRGPRRAFAPTTRSHAASEFAITSTFQLEPAGSQPGAGDGSDAALRISADRRNSVDPPLLLPRVSQPRNWRGAASRWSLAVPGGREPQPGRLVCDADGDVAAAAVT